MKIHRDLWTAPLVSLAIADCEWCWLTSEINPAPVGIRWLQLDLKFANEWNLTFSSYFTTKPPLSFDFGMWHLTSWIMKVPMLETQTKLVPIGHQLFKWDQFNVLEYLSTWPQKTFDSGTWHLTSSINESSHVNLLQTATNKIYI